MEPNCIENEYGDLLKVLMNEFAKNGLKFEKSVNFSKWKLSDLRYLLKLSINYHGFSYLNKEKVFGKVMYVWNKIVSSSNSSSKIVLDDNGHLPIPKDPIIQVSQKENPKFEKWTILKLQDYLGDRDINRTGNKQTLVINALNMNLPVTVTDAQEELHEINQDVFKNFILKMVQYYFVRLT